MIRTVNNECLIQKLLHYFCGSLQNLILRKAFGMAQPNISTNFLKSLDFDLPPLNEQKRIVSKIEELFSNIDSTKQSLKHTKLQLVQYKHSLLKSAFEGKLVSFEPKKITLSKELCKTNYLINFFEVIFRN